MSPSSRGASLEVAPERPCASGTRLDPFVRHTLHSSKLVVLVSEGTWHPPTDVYETTDLIVCRMEVAGVRPEDLQILLAGDTLTIRGRRRDAAATVRRCFRQMEVSYGVFDRTIVVPSPYNPDGIQASYKNGFLEIILPKAVRFRGPRVCIEIGL